MQTNSVPKLTPRQQIEYKKLYYKILLNRGRAFESYLTRDQYEIAHALYIEAEDMGIYADMTVETIILTALETILKTEGILK